ncbi:asparagine synthase (glutamine-hydrolyzing) [Pontibacter sp. G13]|uniref:asparagine synthase (glutamine-hydrolyzing) n=1 Tax=Pontibacter sp. G13 TaxID=3074898 RepID=UPI00288C05E2|nr:asparagine synthase (glutamine-hydrolyzing) [Pontibacter sp. G13]WNJ19272.1 asparagine synthase (glutamine-hydrolyzing) [Pontibacter sp. G13]
MCGIAGIISLPNQGSALPIEVMVQAMHHRGPDFQDHWKGEGVALGHARLSILDLSEAGHQPMHSPEGRYCLIFNGEIYNYLDLKQALPDYPYRGNSDTEVIMAGFIHWGPSFLERLNGMFALAVWDKLERKLFLARDRMGIKPLYYAMTDQGLVFGSEIRTLLASGRVKRKLNRAVLGEYLQYQTVHDPETLVEGIYMLPAGHYAEFDPEGSLDIESYWDMRTYAQHPVDGTYEELCKQVRETFIESVERRKIADVPLGAFLSGGIDSSAVVAALATVSQDPVATFSVVFDEQEFDESTWSSLVAKRYNTQHIPIRLKPDSFLERLPEALMAMDHPSGDGINSYVISEETRKQGFTVALSGLGGDELFCGYPVFQQFTKARGMNLLYKIPAGVRGLIGKSVSGVYQNQKTNRLVQLLEAPQNEFAHLYPIFRQLYNQAELAELGLRQPDDWNLLEKVLPGNFEGWEQPQSVYSQVSVGEMNTYTRSVLLRNTDQMSMASALEVRVPFFDHELVELALQIPDQHKVPTIPKKLLVDAMGDLLPHEVVHRKKMGFVFPWPLWMKDSLKTFCETRIQSIADRGIFEADPLLAQWKGFLAGDKRIPYVKLWTLVVLADWMEKHDIDG